MAQSNVLITIRLLLDERLTRSPTRGDNQKLSVAIWDLHNLMPNNSELFNIWHTMSSAKRDPVRFEAAVQRLAAYLQSSSITGIAPALRTAATFYNQSVSNDRSGSRDTVITPSVSVPDAPRAAPVVSARSMSMQPSAITVERLSSGMLSLSHILHGPCLTLSLTVPSYAPPSANLFTPPPPQPIQPTQSEFTVAVAAPLADPDTYADELPPPGYTYVAEVGAPPSPVPPASPAPPPPAPPVLPEKGKLPPMWENPPASDGAGPSQAGPSASSSSQSPAYSSSNYKPPNADGGNMNEYLSHSTGSHAPSATTPRPEYTHAPSSSIPSYTPTPAPAPIHAPTHPPTSSTAHPVAAPTASAANSHNSYNNHQREYI